MNLESAIDVYLLLDSCFAATHGSSLRGIKSRDGSPASHGRSFGILFLVPSCLTKSRVLFKSVSGFQNQTMT
jgi:hypothetical protein